MSDSILIYSLILGFKNYLVFFIHISFILAWFNFSHQFNNNTLVKANAKITAVTYRLSIELLTYSIPNSCKHIGLLELFNKLSLHSYGQIIVDTAFFV